MKKLLTLSFLFICIVSSGQAVDTTKWIDNVGLGYKYNAWYPKKTFILPRYGAFANDTTDKTPGNIKLIGNSLYFCGADGIWRAPSSSSGGLTSIPAFSVKSLSQLRALTASDSLKDGNMYTSTDGRIFFWNATSTQADDGGVVLDPTSLTGPGRFELLFRDNVFHSSWYLTANVTTDQSASIQKWLDACYRLSKVAYHDKSVGTVYGKLIDAKVSITGDVGAKFEVHSSTLISDYYFFKWTNVSNFFIKNVTLNGNLGVAPGNDLQGTNLVLLQGTDTTNRAKNVLIDNVRFENSPYCGVTSRLVDYLTVQNCFDTITDCLVAVREGSNHTYRNNICHGGTSEAFSLWGESNGIQCSNIVVDGNFVYDKLGIEARYANGFSWINNTIVRSPIGLYVTPVNVTSGTQGATGGYIANNRLIQNQFGIQGNFDHCTITGNTIDSITTTNGNAISIGTRSPLRVFGNLITNNTIKNAATAGYGIVLRNVASSIVSFNEVLENRPGGYAVYQGVYLDSCKGVSAISNRISKSKDNIKIHVGNLADSCIIDNPSDGLAVDNGVTNTKIVSTSTTSVPTWDAVNGSMAINTSGLSGNVLYLRETAGWVPISSAVSNLPAATTLGNGSDAGYWTKVASVTPVGDFKDGNFILAVSGNNGTQQSAILSFGYRQNTTGSPTQPSLSIIAMSSNINNSFVDTGFKVVNNGYGLPFELWIKKTATFNAFTVTELSKKASDAITYLSNQGWVSGTPTGTYVAQTALSTTASLVGTNAWSGPNSWSNVSTFTNRTVASGNITASAWGAAGLLFSTSPSIYTDNSTSGTQSLNAVTNLRTPTLAYTNATTVTDASTINIEGPPNAGTNATITKSWAIRVGAGSSTMPTLIVSSGLQTTGSFATNINTTPKTTAYNITATDGTVLCDATAAAFVATLPTAAGKPGQMILIKKIDASANAITVGTVSSQNIEGVTTTTTYSLPTKGKWALFQSDNVAWQIIGSN